MIRPQYAPPVLRVLRLTNSTDMDPRVPDDQKAPWLAVREFGDSIGEDIELTVKMIWPSQSLPALVDRWLDEFQPDVVVLCVNSFWYLYPSVPLRLRRRFGRAGSAAASAGLRVGGAKFVSRSPAYHAIRRNLTRVIGADTHFSPDQTVETVEALLRRILAREQVVPLVRGGITAHGAEIGGRWSRFSLERWREVDTRVRRLCDGLHVEYLSLESAKLPMADEYASDVIHVNADGHAWRGPWEAAGLLRAWERVHAGSAAGPGP
jgi:hypothetical protein